MSELVAFAERELALLQADAGEADEYQRAINKNVLDVVKIFAEGGHSGSSAPYAIQLIRQLLMFRPIKPLTGEADEWMQVSDDLWQNRRCGHVFKDNDGPYDSQGIVFRDPDGTTWLGSGSRVRITFPYMPGDPQVMDRNADGTMASPAEIAATKEA